MIEVELDRDARVRVSDGVVLLDSLHEPAVFSDLKGIQVGAEPPVLLNRCAANCLKVLTFNSPGESKSCVLRSSG